MHACKRTRLAGNQFSNLILGEFGESQNWCNDAGGTDPGLPDPLGAGAVKGARSFGGVNYDGDNPNDPDKGIKIRAHSGTITIRPNTCPGTAWVQNLDSAPGSPAPAEWLTQLQAQYPWITGICPNPTSLTGGPGGSAPWSVAQALTRGDAAVSGTPPNESPKVGPFRPGPGGLP